MARPAAKIEMESILAVGNAARRNGPMGHIIAKSRLEVALSFVLFAGKKCVFPR